MRNRWRPSMDAPAARPDGPGGADSLERRVRERALRLLAVRDRSRAELVQRLGEAAPPDVVEGVVRWLEGLGYVDDRRFAENWVKSRSRRYGPVRLEMELRGKGLAPEAVEDALARCAPDEESLEEAAFDMVRRRLGREGAAGGAAPGAAGGSRDGLRLRRRLTAMLLRRGYPSGIAQRAVERALQADGHDSLTCPDP